MQRFTKFTEAPNAVLVVKGLLKLLIAALLLLYYVPRPDFEPGLLGQLGQLVAGALAVDALLSPLLNKQTSFAAAALKLLVSCAKYLLALIFALIWTKNFFATNWAGSLVITLLLVVLALWKLTEHWREWQRQWVQQENQLPAPPQSKPQEMPRSSLREMSVPPTIPEQVQTPQTIPAPTITERRADGYYSVARRQGSLIHFLLWLLFLLMFVFSVLILLMLPFAAALTAFVPPSGFWSAYWDDGMGEMTAFFLILILLVVINGSRQCVWRKWRYGYDVDSDKFFRDSGSVWGSFQRDESWPADDFVAIYWKKCGWAKAQLWLKSCDDYEDVPLTDRKSGNEWFVRRLAKELSAASGLPVQPQP